MRESRWRSEVKAQRFSRGVGTMTASCIVLSLCLLTMIAAGAPGDGGELKLWYDRPADTWMTEALPIGNGRIGAMIFGGLGQERVQFNESSLWSGGPNENPDYKGGNIPGGAEHIKEIQALLRDGKVPAAEELIKKFQFGTLDGFGAYQAMGDLLIDFPGQPT